MQSDILSSVNGGDELCLQNHLQTSVLAGQAKKLLDVLCGGRYGPLSQLTLHPRKQQALHNSPWSTFPWSQLEVGLLQPLEDILHILQMWNPG